MALRATKNTYGIERLRGGIEIRRRVIAGQDIPPGLDVPKGDLEEHDADPVGHTQEQVTRRTGGKAKTGSGKERKDS